MYADDATLYCCLEDMDSINPEQILITMLTHAWLSANKLTSNANKSNYRLFGKRTNTHLS